MDAKTAKITKDYVSHKIPYDKSITKYGYLDL